MTDWPYILAATPMNNGGSGPPGWDGHMMYMPYGGLPMILILGAFFIFIVLMLRGRNTRREESPLDILKRRYANGEIDKERFEQMKKDLEK